MSVFFCVPDQSSSSDNSELDDWPKALQLTASRFQTRADKLKRKHWWKNMEVPVPSNCSHEYSG